MIQYLMQVPPEFWAKVAEGGAYVEGSLVKDSATKLILTHLQPTGQLTNALAGVGGGPLGGITAVSSRCRQYSACADQEPAWKRCKPSPPLVLLRRS